MKPKMPLCVGCEKNLAKKTKDRRWDLCGKCGGPRKQPEKGYWPMGLAEERMGRDS